MILLSRSWRFQRETLQRGVGVGDGGLLFRPRGCFCHHSHHHGRHSGGLQGNLEEITWWSIPVVAKLESLLKLTFYSTSLSQMRLFYKECPKTVENFVVHSREGYYNGHLFHRVIKGFMVQTGDPTGKSWGCFGNCFKKSILVGSIITICCLSPS